MKKLTTFEQLETILNQNDWTFYNHRDSKDFDYFGFEFYSPAGEDVIMEFDVSNYTLENCIDELESYAFDFDPADHACRWYKQNKGEPISLIDLVNDANSIKKEILSMAKKLRCALNGKCYKEDISPLQRFINHLHDIVYQSDCDMDAAEQINYAIDALCQTITYIEYEENFN